MYEFYRQNRDFIIAFILVTIIGITGVWLVYDHGRNEPIYHDTDNGVERLEKRLDDIGQRIDAMQERIEQNQKTIERTVITIERSRENAETIAGGISEAERRLDDAIQTSGRIKNRIEEIERANRPGTENTPKTDMAK